MSPLKIEMDGKHLDTIPAEGGVSTVCGGIVVYYMGDLSLLYAVAEEGQFLVSAKILTDLPAVLAVHSRLVPHPDAGNPPDVVSDYLTLRYAHPETVDSSLEN